MPGRWSTANTQAAGGETSSKSWNIPRICVDRGGEFTDKAGEHGQNSGPGQDRRLPGVVTHPRP